MTSGALRAIESLRSGVPSREATRSLPDIRSEVTDLFRGDLEALSTGGTPEGRILWGEFGQGKTHMLTAIEHAALDRGFAVSRVTLSREVCCHQFHQFYGRAAAAIRVPDSSIPGLLGPLLRTGGHELAGSPIHALGRYAHPLPAIVLEGLFMAEGEDRDLLYGDLAGTPVRISELRRIHKAWRGEALPKFAERFRPPLHASAYFGVMADAVRLCGYKGWILLVDEAELIGRLGKSARLAVYQNLNALLGWSGALPYPLYSVVAAASRLKTERMYEGAAARKDDRTVITELAAVKAGPAARLQVEAFFRRAIGPSCPTVRQASASEVSTVLAGLADLHGQAYGWRPDVDLSELPRELPNVPVRTLIRAAIEVLDVRFLRGETVVPRAARLLEPSLAEDERFFDLAGSVGDF